MEAVRKALAVGGEHLLYKVGKQEGLFKSRSGLQGQAAATALEKGFLELSKSDGEGKKLFQWARLTAKGIRFLHERESPARSLDEALKLIRKEKEDLSAGLARMRMALEELSGKLMEEAVRWTSQLEGMERQVGDALERLDRAVPMVPEELGKSYPWALESLRFLQWRLGEANGKRCSLPELFDLLQTGYPDLNCQTFHEGLLRLRQAGVIRLEKPDSHADMPRPEFALLDNGQVYYFLRR